MNTNSYKFGLGTSELAFIKNDYSYKCQDPK